MTGIEAAAELAAARPDLRVRLVTGGRLGGWLSSLGRDELAARLERLGVETLDQSRVAAVERRALVLTGDDEVPFDLAVWCGGFAHHALARDSGLATDARGALLVDETLRSTSHPQIVGAGDAAAVPALPNGAAFRMTCQAGMPSGAHAADTVVAVLRDREPTAFDLGYIHQPISLGRRDGLIQWVDRADRPKDRVLTGRRAALYKEFVTRGALIGIRMERSMPGRAKWLKGGVPVLDGAGAPHAAS
jgi:NADH dehydrogenase FAD-containing subunit